MLPLESPLSTLKSHSRPRQRPVGSTRKRIFAPDFSDRGGFTGLSLLSESIKPGDDRCISPSRHESLCRLPQRSIAGEELAVELVEAGQRPLDEIRRVELEKRAQRRLRYRHLHFREKIVDGVITGSHRVAEQVPSFEGANRQALPRRAR